MSAGFGSGAAATGEAGAVDGATVELVVVGWEAAVGWTGCTTA